MRLPTYKVYRAFPELDRFSDEACQRYVRAARRGQEGWLGLAPLALGLSGGFVLFMAMLGLIFAVGILAPSLRWGPVLPFAMSGSVALAGGAAAFFTFQARDVLLRRVLEKLLKLATCPHCRYSLLGLRIDAGVVSCPECGRSADVRKDLALNEDQLLAGEIQSRPFDEAVEPGAGGVGRTVT